MQGVATGASMPRAVRLQREVVDAAISEGCDAVVNCLASMLQSGAMALAPRGESLMASRPYCWGARRRTFGG